MRTVMRKLDQESEFTGKIVEVDWIAESEVAQAYQVYGVPSLLLFKDSKVVRRHSGVFDARDLLNKAQLAV